MSKQQEITEKTCTRCEVEKPVEEFYGIERSRCKECERVEASERMKRYNGTFRGKASGALQTSKKAVRRIERETGRKIKDDLTLLDVAFVLSFPQCSYCGEDIPEADRTLDHITPLKDGGANTFSNITQACRSCNSRKSDYPALSYLHQNQDAWMIRQLVDKLAQRDRISYDEAFMRLFEDAVNYFYELKEAEGNTD